MHHFIYPQQDTFISDVYPNQNFGLDEILRVGTTVRTVQLKEPTRPIDYAVTASVLCVANFSGSITGSVSGSISNGMGVFSTAYFSGSADQFTSSINGFSGSISGSSITGIVTSSFDGSVTNFTGRILNSIVIGTSTLSQSHIVVQSVKNTDRSLVKFDLTAISKSVADGDIPMPRFKLHLKTARAENLPVDYIIYAFPISQSWTMGNGYFWDGGSTKGANWNFRDLESGSLWYPLTSSVLTTPIDFVSNPEQASASWGRGGATWYTASALRAEQDFSYEGSDVVMDVTRMAEAWISGTIHNDGMILLTSDELFSTASDMRLLFFSEDTNTIYRPYLDAGWDDTVFVTGSVSTGSVTITTIPAGILGTVQSGASITGSSVTGSFNAVANINTTDFNNVIGSVNGLGLNNTISQSAIFGNISGSISQSIAASTTSSFLLATFLDGYFSGSNFTSSLKGVMVFGYLTGSWNESQLVGNLLSASYPFPIFPSVFVQMTGRFIEGTILGTYTTTNSTGSGVFSGVVTDGPFVGAQVYLPFSGSALTASYSYTSSVVMTSQSLEPLEVNQPFVTVVQNLPSVVKSNSIIRVNVFAREEFPLKNFNRKTQFSQFLTTKYLPTSSYYAVKDNETEEIILDFDNYTQINCDEQGNYFLLDTSGLPQERYFKILIKTEMSSSVYIFDRNDIFKIVR